MDSDKIPSKRKRTFSNVNLNVLDYISNRNLFLLCCIAACFSLVSIKIYNMSTTELSFSCYYINEFMLSVAVAHNLYYAGRDMTIYILKIQCCADNEGHIKYMRRCSVCITLIVNSS